MGEIISKTLQTVKVAAQGINDGMQAGIDDAYDDDAIPLNELECIATSPKTGEKCQRAAVHSGMHFFYDAPHDQTVEWI